MKVRSFFSHDMKMFSFYQNLNYEGSTKTESLNAWFLWCSGERSNRLYRCRMLSDFRVLRTSCPRAEQKESATGGPCISGKVKQMLQNFRCSSADGWGSFATERALHPSKEVEESLSEHRPPCIHVLALAAVKAGIVHLPFRSTCWPSENASSHNWWTLRTQRLSPRLLLYSPNLLYHLSFLRVHHTLHWQSDCLQARPLGSSSALKLCVAPSSEEKGLHFLAWNSKPFIIWSPSTPQLTPFLSCSSQMKWFLVHVQSSQLLLAFFWGRSTPFPFCSSLQSSIFRSKAACFRRPGVLSPPSSCVSMVLSLH